MIMIYHISNSRIWNSQSNMLVIFQKFHWNTQVTWLPDSIHFASAGFDRCMGMDTIPIANWKYWLDVQNRIQ